MNAGEPFCAVCNNVLDPGDAPAPLVGPVEPRGLRLVCMVERCARPVVDPAFPAMGEGYCDIHREPAGFRWPGCDCDGENPPGTPQCAGDHATPATLAPLAPADRDATWTAERAADDAAFRAAEREHVARRRTDLRNAAGLARDGLFWKWRADLVFKLLVRLALYRGPLMLRARLRERMHAYERTAERCNETAGYLRDGMAVMVRP